MYSPGILKEKKPREFEINGIQFRFVRSFGKDFVVERYSYAAYAWLFSSGFDTEKDAWLYCVEFAFRNK
jgi:hypothetical protein